MATRAEIEAEMNQKLGIPPRKQTRAEIEAEMAQKLFQKPLSVRDYMASARGLAESEKALKAVEAENNFGQNMLAGAGKVVSDLGSGGQQIAARVMGDDEKLAQLQADEAEERRLVEPLTSSAGGITGNILTNAALFAVPGAQAGKAATAGTTALKMSPRAAQLLGAMIGEGAIGGLGGLLTPTTADESLSGNVGASAALNAVMPGVGAVLKSKPVQAAADTVLDYTPLVAGARRRARNAAGEAAYGAEKAAFDAAKREAAERTRYATSLRDQEALQEKMLYTDNAQKAITEAAGWSKFPTNKVEMETELKRIGSKYGALIEPVRMPVPDVSDLVEQPDNVIGGYVRKLNNAAQKNGAVPGETYKEVRADIMEELQNAQGEGRGQLKELLKRLDAGFEASIPPEKFDEVIKKRTQYSLGSTMRGAEWTPGKGADIPALRKRIDRRELSPELRGRLYEAEEAIGRTKGRDAVTPFEVGMDAPEKFRAEASDPIRLAAINMGLGGGLSAVMGGAPAAMTMASLPLLATGVKQATNPKVAKTVNALRRGATIGYGTVLAPEQED
jgi:hypothetical protein